MKLCMTVEEAAEAASVICVAVNAVMSVEKRR